MTKKRRFACCAVFAGLFLIFLWRFSGLEFLPGDDYMYQAALHAPGGLMQWLADYYTGWSSRVLPALLIVLFVNLPLILMSAVHAVCMTWICWFAARYIARLRGSAALWGSAVFAVLFLVLGNRAVVDNAVLWCAASPFYLWMLAAGFLAVRYVQLPPEERTGAAWALALIGAALAGCYEQAGPLVIGWCGVMLAEETLRTRRFSLRTLAVCLAAFAVMLSGFFCPGNAIRSRVETLHNNPAYAGYGLPDQLSIAVVYLCKELMEFALPLLLVLAGCMAVLQLLRRRWLPLAASALCGGYFAGGLLFKKGLLPGAGQWLYGYLHFESADLLADASRPVSVTVCIAVLCALGLLYLLYLPEQGVDPAAGCLLFGAMAEVMILALTPAYLVSRLRILFPAVILLLMAALCCLVQIWRVLPFHPVSERNLF